MAIKNLLTGMLIAVVATAAIIAGLLMEPPTSLGTQESAESSQVGR